MSSSISTCWPVPASPFGNGGHADKESDPGPLIERWLRLYSHRRGSTFESPHAGKPANVTCVDGSARMPDPDLHPFKVAIVWRGDTQARADARPETSRLKAVFEALERRGIAAEPAV